MNIESAEVDDLLRMKLGFPKHEGTDQLISGIWRDMLHQQGPIVHRQPFCQETHSYEQPLFHQHDGLLKCMPASFKQYETRQPRLQLLDGKEHPAVIRVDILRILTHTLAVVFQDTDAAVVAALQGAVLRTAIEFAQEIPQS